MHDVGPAEFAKQQRQVRQLGRNRAQVLDLDQRRERRRRNGVDRHQPGLDIRIAVPGADEPGGLDGLAAENTHGGCNDRHLQAAALYVFRLPHHDFPGQLCKSRAPHSML